MIASSKRLTIPLFKNVMDNGKLFHSPVFSVKFLKVSGLSRFSVAVSKKIAKNAVDRNKIRRRVYTAIRMLEDKIPQGFHGVFMVKATILKMSLVEIGASLEAIFVKSGILK